MLNKIKALLLGMLLLAPAATAYELGSWNIHGTFSQGFVYSTGNNFIADSKDGTFDFREFGLNATTFVGERVTVGGQVFGRKYGIIGDDEVFLDWLSASYSFSDAFGLRAGKLKIPYGLYGETRDIDSLRTQILLPQGVYVESYRGSVNAMWGGQAFGNVYSKDFGSVDYSIQYGQSAIDVDSGELNRLATYIQLEADNVNDDEAGAFKLLWNTPLSGLRLGSTITWTAFEVTGPTDGLLGFPSQYNADLHDQKIFVTSAEYRVGRTTFAAEHLRSELAADVVFNALSALPFELEVNLSGYYLSVDHQVTDTVTVGAGYSGVSVKQKIALPGLQTSEKEKQEGAYVTLRYDVTSNINVKLEQHIITGRAALFTTENPEGIKEDWSMTLLKFSVVF